MTLIIEPTYIRFGSIEITVERSRYMPSRGDKLIEIERKPRGLNLCIRGIRLIACKANG
jgi:hypothetical protein